MGFGSTAKTIQRVADMAEEVYTRLNDVREKLEEMRSTVQTTNERVSQLEHEIAEQRAIIEALAEKEGVDVDSVTADIHITEAEKAAANVADTGGADSTANTDADGSTGKN